MIDEAAGRGADLTQRLLAFARRQPLQPREVDVNDLVVETVKLLKPTLGEHIEVEALLKDGAAAGADRSEPADHRPAQSVAEFTRRDADRRPCC